jgi:hypothetical protein
MYFVNCQSLHMPKVLQKMDIRGGLSLYSAVGYSLTIEFY